MSNRYKDMSVAELAALWEEKRKRIADLPPADRLPSDMDELLSMRKELDKRKGERNPTIDVNFSEVYLTD